MYGLVNMGVRHMVTETFGSEKWLEIWKASGVDDVFISMEPYPDEVTIKLVGAASHVLGLEPSQVLHAFGKWWISFAAREYGALFSMTGDCFADFTANLNAIHTRVAYMLPKLTPPAFKITDRQPDGSFTLHYYSQRDGLFPMVQGMIEGIGAWFQSPVEVEHLSGTDEGPTHHEFLVRYAREKVS